MYPVLSVLRRAAVSYVLVTPEMLALEDGQLSVRMSSPTSYLELEGAKWSSKPSDLIPMSELVVRASTGIEAAISMAKKENGIAEAVRAEDAVYTLILGPEQEMVEGGQVVRRSRYAVARGVYRAVAGRLEPVKAKNVKKAIYSRTNSSIVRLD